MPLSNDTRTIQPGDTYVAIRGDVHDGHDFIPQAIEKGATGVITEKQIAVGDGIEVILVENSVDYLITEAQKKVATLSPDIVAITGSVGKTSTRSAIQAVLSEKFEVVASEGNKNTPLGLSMTLLNAQFDSGTKLVLEMGARLQGDIKELCSYFRPTVAVVTNVKGVHLETFGSFEGIQQEKSELVRALSDSGVACLNGDDPRTLEMADLHTGRVILFGATESCDLRPEHITAELPILGDHAIYTALAASAAGRALGMSFDDVNHGLAEIKPEKGRLAKLKGLNDSILIDDTYNASPEATLSALHVLVGIPGVRHVAFLGDMLELGPTEVTQHASVLEKALSQGVEVHAVGPIMAKAAEALREPLRNNIHLHPTSISVVEDRRFTPQADDVILVKGSQGTRMERISEMLLHPDLDPADVLPRQSKSWKQIG